MTEKKQSNGYVLVMVLYLVGIFMGAIDTGIVTPARTVIQSQLGVSAQTGMWMITIYTLSYAASVPIMGKLADRFGRKYIYLICIFLFGFGSFMCGLSGSIGGFPLLIVARVIQAIGGGGIVPIATAEFGTTFPPEKRGMALGLVGGVYGVANVFGASAGSAILDIFGVENWKYIFYINVPITIFIVICGCFKLQNNMDENNNKKIDILGIFTVTIMVLSLLYGLKNLDFFNFTTSITSTKVYPFLIIFALLIPLFIFAEKRAEDPVLSLKYFTNKNILITLVLSTLSGVVMMGTIFVPQFSENCLKLSTGSGGYLVIILGVFSGFGAPVSGKLIDKHGPKIILASGFLGTALGALFMMFVTIKFPSLLTVLIGLALIGLGMGFTMGTPVNYMMLDNTESEESNSALAALSLVRSLGTAVAPAIMVGFIAAAGGQVETNLMEMLPAIEMPVMDSMGDMGDMSAMGGMESADMELPAELLTMLQSSDVTTIVEDTKVLASYMFDQMFSSGPMAAMKEMAPDMVDAALQSYLADIDNVGPQIEDTFQATLNEGFFDVYRLIVITAALAILVLFFYKGKEKAQ
ncbi:MAG: MFS transporter [Pseudobutyrivibrio sp.]|nr:MFS transporter [Pseudobutyrivibrio sp.]